MKSTAKLAPLLLLVSTLLIACGGDKPEALIASAKGYLAKNDSKAAIIQIKNALQANPNLPEARYLLGRALLDEGDPVSAEVEFRKALALDQPKDLVVPALAKAMLVQGQYGKAIDEFAAVTLSSPSATAELQGSLADAYAASGKAELSQAALKAALTANPNYVPAQLESARQRAARGEVDAAMSAVEETLAKSPDSHDAWRLKGDFLFYYKKQVDDALVAYRKSVALKPGVISGHLSILTALLQQGKLDDADKELVELKKVAGNRPQVKYVQAQLAYYRKDFKLAKDLTQDLLKQLPGNANVLQLAGAVEFQTNSLVQAEAYLQKALQASPGLGLARRQLVATYLRSGQSEKALSALHAGGGPESLAPELYSLAGQVYLQGGDVKKAAEFFSKATKTDPADTGARTSLALTHLASGDASSAFGELQDIAGSDKSTVADLALISAYSERNEIDKALAAVDGLEKKQPKNPQTGILRGRLLLAKRDNAGARASFERVLEIDPSYFPALASLASMDISEKKPADAKKRFEAAVARDPKNNRAWLALAELAAASGEGKEEVAKLLNRAIAANPSEAAPRLALINLHLKTGDIKQASSVAQNAVAALPDSADLLEALGRTQHAAGEFNQALATYNKLAGQQPNSPQPYVRLAEAYRAAKNRDAAEKNLRKALDIQPDFLLAQRGLIALQIEAKKLREAVDIAKTVQKQRPKEATGYLLEGDIAGSEKNWDTAVAAYRTGLKQAPSTELAIRLAATLSAAKKTGESRDFASAWMKDHPRDVAFLLYRGDEALANKDFPAAEVNYLAAVKLQPGNAGAYNNLAWVTSRLKKDGAVGYAETANKLAPNQPAFMDTLAMLLSEKKDYARAIELQTKAVTLQPKSSAMKLNLARMYVQSGDKERAKVELELLAKLGPDFPAQAEVATLMKGL